MPNLKEFSRPETGLRRLEGDHDHGPEDSKPKTSKKERKNEKSERKSKT